MVICIKLCLRDTHGKVVQRFGTCLCCLDERDIPSKFAVSTPDTV